MSPSDWRASESAGLKNLCSLRYLLLKPSEISFLPIKQSHLQEQTEETEKGKLPFSALTPLFHLLLLSVLIVARQAEQELAHERVRPTGGQVKVQD